MFDDLLLCLTRPEWPAAELLLFHLMCNLDKRYLNGVAPDDGKHGREMHDRMRLKTVELLGRFTLHFKQEANLANRLCTETITTPNTSDDVADWYVPAPLIMEEAKPPTKKAQGRGRKRKNKEEDGKEDEAAHEVKEVFLSPYPSSNLCDL